jgi:hypothetical protein
LRCSMTICPHSRASKKPGEARRDTSLDVVDPFP